MRKLIGVLLVALGIIGLVYGEFTYTKDRDTAELGSLEITVKDEEEIRIPPVVGVVLIVGGVLVFLSGAIIPRR
jgi:uncharacterized membrane protein YidH (DUF202 family)